MGRCRIPLDLYDMKPEGMIAYLRYNGYHFNKKMCEWAVSKMRRDGSTITFLDKEKVESMLKSEGVTLQNVEGYDHVYVANMVRADYWNKSIKDEKQMCQFVKDMVDDEDQKDGFIFNRFYADCCHNGLPIPWEDVL